MGTGYGENFTRLITELEEEAPSFNVFQAIYLGERTSKKLYPDRNDDQLEQTGLHFRPYENYVYPPTDLRSFVFEADIMKYIINFMGLYGVNAPLPRCYHEQVAVQQTVHDTGKVPLQNFLDIFNNRFYWLYYLAWKKYRYYLHVGEKGENKTAQRVFSFIGLGFQDVRHTRAISPFRLFRMSGILSNRVRSKAGLQILLNEFFPRFRFRIREFVPSMVKLSELPGLGISKGSKQHRLGLNSVIGRSITDFMSKICIEISSLDFDDYLSFLPDGQRMKQLKQVIDLYISDTLTYDIQFFVFTDKIKTVPWNDKRLKLGQSIWLGKPKGTVIDAYYPYEKINH
jgi:type VI secretion system protein ImpH